MNPDGTADQNAVSLYETSSGKVLVYETIDGSAGTAALKITSQASSLRVSAGRMIGGRENCVDLNNGCQDVVVECDEFEVRGKYALSAKACRGVAFRGHLSGRPGKWHVNLGSWSDQNKGTQTGTHLALTADAYPILVWVGNATVPTMDDPKKYRLMGFGRYGALVRAVVMFGWDIAKRLNFD